MEIDKCLKCGSERVSITAEGAGNETINCLDCKTKMIRTTSPAFDFAVTKITETSNKPIVSDYIKKTKDQENIDHPQHYNDHPSGIECLDIVRHMNFNLGNVIKYVWRAGLKSDDAIEDLKKARFYIDDEIERLESD